MWPFVKARLPVLALVVSLVPLLLPDVARAQGDGDATKSSSSAEPTCESRTVNYITDSLPQQCLTTGPITSIPIPETASTTTATGSASTSTEAPAHAAGDAAHDDLGPEGEDLSTGAFMSFEEWKAMMLAKSGPDALDAKSRRQKDGRGGGGDAGPGDGFDSLGDEGEISFDFDAYSDKISEIASSARPREQHEKEPKEQVEMVTYDEGFTYYRSKDAGTTCKERFSYSSFDAGATVKKTSPGAKNPTAILVENKDSYMLLECGRKNKFFIVELSDVILVDTVVIANFEFFSSMVREFRVSISDRYPVKLDKWKTLGTFQARNSRDIQPFLIENPQDWARYLRVEILSHYGNEYYCPVSLLRVHGLRMLDSWKQVDPSELEGEDESPPSISEPVEEPIEVVDEQPVETVVVEPMRTHSYSVVTEQSSWAPYWDGSYFDHAFPLICAPDDGANLNTSISNDGAHQKRPTEPQSTTSVDERAVSAMPNTSSVATAARQTTDPSTDVTKPGSSVSTAAERPVGAGISVPSPSPSGSRDNTSIAASSTSMSQTTNENAAAQNSPKTKSSASTSIKPPSSRSSTKASSGSPTTVRNKTSTTAGSLPPTPTVQDSFFKALTKRLQILESNSTLSLQYIESQSRFLQEALAKLERRQIAKVDLFLDKLNNTVLGELREVRTLYDHIWQSTVIALESQREQTEHEIVALSTRVGVLADEVVFQKRMAIVQSVLLLGCLVLVIFSRGFAGSAVEAYYPSQFLASSSPRVASPILPSTPKTQLKGSRLSMSLSGEQSSANTTPVRTRATGHSTQTGLRVTNGRSSNRTPKAHNGSGSKGAGPDSVPQVPTPNRALSDPSGLDFQPPTPSSIDDMAYDSEPAMTPNGDYFSAATSVNDDESSATGGDSDEIPRIYPEMLARQSERQLTPTSDAEASEYMMPRSGRPGLTHSGSTRKPLPALPEDPD
ncbi:UNC-like C-terminal-domain-containing protein [Nemania abortiva]|nr:UNC-like C-terminal-domain-containing protein [Nemania abortiva]